LLALYQQAALSRLERLCNYDKVFVKLSSHSSGAACHGSVGQRYCIYCNSRPAFTDMHDAAGMSSRADQLVTTKTGDATLTCLHRLNRLPASNLYDE